MKLLNGCGVGFEPTTFGLWAYPSFVVNEGISALNWGGIAEHNFNEG
jgi:hypothetical protein